MGKGNKVISIEMVDHKEEVLLALGRKVNNWLESVGEDAAGTAAKKAPYKTGNLRNSISYQVHSDKHMVEIGTNVEYAPAQEYGTKTGIKGKHFIRFGATAHTSAYKQWLEEMLKGG